MRCRTRLFPAILIVSVLLAFSSAESADKFKLKPDARGKNCLNCHVMFKDKLNNPYIHTPVKTGDCTGCHNPHTAAHEKFLSAGIKDICLKCHTKLLPEKAVSTHKPVAEGECMKCHDPHSEKNKFNLKKPGNALCFECHKEMGDLVSKVKFKHSPVEKGCTNCHSPHASTASVKQLKDQVPGLCLKCHDAKKAVFQNMHMGYPVAGSQCTSCHNPHGSDQRGLLYNRVHSPFAKKMCKECHSQPSSPEPLKLQKTGFELCQKCHSPKINEFFSKNRVHWALLDKKGCLNCHNPHASNQEGLLKKPMMIICGQCHTDTVEKIKKAESKHPPVQEGNCTACHSPHSSDQLSLLGEASVIDVCGQCHDWKQHSMHPIGPKFTDKRNRNLTVTCLSCHRPHGTEYKRMMFFPNSTDTCTDCHEQLKR